MRRHQCSLPILLIALISCPATADTHRVPSVHATIQTAIDACAEGDTVLVAPGSYSGPGNTNLSLSNVNLVLIGDGDPEDIIIDGESLEAGIEIGGGLGEGTVVARLTFFRCSSGYLGGGAIHCEDASPTLRDLVIDSCSSLDLGGGCWIQGGSPQLQRLRFQRNAAIHFGELGHPKGGAIYARDTELYIEDCEFVRNTASQVYGWECCPSASGGAIYATGEGALTIRSTGFIGNKVSVNGTGTRAGAAIWTDMPVTIEGAVLYGDPFHSYGGAAIHAESSIAIERTVFTENWRSLDVTADLDLSCSVFYANTDDSTWSTYPDVFVGDPLLCDPMAGDLCVSSESPCLPENNECATLIGNGSVGCGGSSPPEELVATWGRLDGIGLEWSWSGDDQLGFMIQRDGELVHLGEDPEQRAWFDSTCAAGGRTYSIRARLGDGLGTAGYSRGYRKPESLTIERPNGGEQFNVGSELNIQWTSEQMSSQARVELSRSGPKGPWELLADGTDDDGTLEWVVTEPHSSNCLLRISDPLDGHPSDTMTESFKIGARKLMVPEGYPTIATALAAAEQGDTVSLAQGIYFEHGLELLTGTRLMGRDGFAENCILDGQGLGPILTTQDGYVLGTTIANLTFRGGEGSDGGALVLSRFASIDNCRFEDNHASHGGAAHISLGAEFNNCTFVGNSATIAGGAIYAMRMLAISQCSFIDNASSGFGGALALIGSQGYAIESSRFERNSATEEGGAAYCHSAVGYFESSLVFANSAEFGGAFSMREFASPILRDCTIVGNHSASDG